MLYGLSDKQWNEILTIIKHNQAVEAAILFGSRAKGNYRKGSDVDIALKGNKLALKDVFSIANQLEDTYLPYTFDIVLYHTIDDPAVLEHINRVGISLFENVNLPDVK